MEKLITELEKLKIRHEDGNININDLITKVIKSRDPNQYIKRNK